MVHYRIQRYFILKTNWRFNPFAPVSASIHCPPYRRLAAGLKRPTATGARKGSPIFLSRLQTGAPALASFRPGPVSSKLTAVEFEHIFWFCCPWLSKLFDTNEYGN
jgi:hypothetical protein